MLLFHIHTSPQKFYIELTFWSWTDACEKLMHKSTRIQLSMHCMMLLFSLPWTKHFIHSSYWETCERVRLCILWHFANFIDYIFGVSHEIFSIFIQCRITIQLVAIMNQIERNKKLENWDCVEICYIVPSSVVNN